MITELVRRALFPAPRELAETPAAYGSEYEEVSFGSQDGCRLSGWWLSRDRALATVIFFHGNAENIGDWANLAVDLAFLQSSIFLFDYRGYGSSHGSPSETGLYRDGRAAFDYVREECASVPVVAMGRSLGGAVAIEVARSRPVAGLVVDSSFTCIAEMAKTMPLLKVLPRSVLSVLVRSDPFDSISRVGGLGMPKLFAHSRTDEVIPYHVGERLFDAAADPKAFCSVLGGHNRVKFGQKRYRQALLELVRCCSAAGAKGRS
jgi:fermentation-respiration switch protein FrsA (DUF1100 family)